MFNLKKKKLALQGTPGNSRKSYVTLENSRELKRSPGNSRKLQGTTGNYRELQGTKGDYRELQGAPLEHSIYNFPHYFCYIKLGNV